MSTDQPGAQPATRIPPIISVDDHVVEPPHVWERWLPAKLKARGPRIERRKVAGMSRVGGSYDWTFADEGDPCDVWVFEDKVFPQKRHIAAVGFDRDDMTLSPITYEEMRPGCYDPAARLDDMTMNHVERSLCFPTFPRYCGQTFTEIADRELGLACVQAYNDWMIEEWCGDSGGRLIPLTIIPLWDAELAAVEVHRNADRGAHAVCFSEIPPYLDLPSIYTDAWDPVFAACEATDTAICMHVGSSSRMPKSSPDAPPAAAATLSFNHAMASLTDWLFSGKLVQFPGLKLAYSEGQIGWLPYVLERADTVWLEHRAWGGVKDLVPEPPSTYYRSHVYGCFIRDDHGLRSLDEIGEDTVTFETDYPHTDSTWPNTLAVAEKMFADLSDEVVHKIVRGNAIRLLSLDGA